MKSYVGLVFVVAAAWATGVLYALQPPASRSPVRDYLRSVTVEAPARYRNLSIYPVCSSRPSRPELLSLDEAVRNHDLIVREIGEGEVNTLSVENVGKLPVYIMAGEILEGAKQTRVLQSDVLVPPHSGRLDIGAFCVEHGRWSYQSEDKTFHSDSYMSNPAVRAKAAESRDQGAVWAEVDETHRRLQVPEQTGALTEAYRAPQIQEDVGPYVRALGELPEENPHMVGAVVMVGDRLLCADAFGPRSLTTALWPKLIRSYALEAVAQPDNDEKSGDGRAAAQALLERASEAGLEKESTPGLGLLEDITGRSVTGSVLVYQQWPLHVALFPHESYGRPQRPEEDSVPAIQRSYPR
ncbi:MAG TPA: DUF6569 family protein [Candidatus Xenobia bacterium]